MANEEQECNVCFCAMAMAGEPVAMAMARLYLEQQVTNPKIE